MRAGTRGSARRRRQGRVADVGKASRFIPLPSIRIRATCAQSSSSSKITGARGNEDDLRYDLENLVAGAHSVIIHFARRALFIAITVIVPGENSEPGAILVIDKVLPTIGPNAIIPVPILY